MSSPPQPRSTAGCGGKSYCLILWRTSATDVLQSQSLHAVVNELLDSLLGLQKRFSFVVIEVCWGVYQLDFKLIAPDGFTLVLHWNPKHHWFLCFSRFLSCQVWLGQSVALVVSICGICDAMHCDRGRWWWDQWFEMGIFLTNWWYTTSLVIVCIWCAQAQEANHQAQDVNHQVGVVGGDEAGYSVFVGLRFEIFKFKC